MGNLFQELKRRKVFRVAAVYTIVAWAFEMTPEGIKADAEAQPTRLTAQSSDRKLIYAILGLVLLLAGFQVSDHFHFNEQPAMQERLFSGMSNYEIVDLQMASLSNVNTTISVYITALSSL